MAGKNGSSVSTFASYNPTAYRYSCAENMKQYIPRVSSALKQVGIEEQ
ncbi:MAG: hypothetical protein QME51_08670 [Planctomycetota bacterium]|nr:hypothetical protein [Planctomycetota bacterium]